MVPIAKPCALLHYGRMRVAEGENRRGRRRLEAAVMRAHALGMTGVEAAGRRSLAAVNSTAAEHGGHIAWG